MPGSARPRSQAPKIAREACEALVELMFSQKARVEHVAAEFELSAPQAGILWHLGEGPAVPMGMLATQMHCDPSNITGMVDKLEHRGLLRRAASTEDRRVKLLEITPAGLDIRSRFLAAVREPPPWLLALSSSDQCLLRDVARRALEKLQSFEHALKD